MARMLARNDSNNGDQLEALRAILDTAARVLQQLAADPVLRRLLTAFERMPAEDREPIVEVIEREVEMRLLGSSQGDVLTGRDLVPNPNARLYLRVVEGRMPPPTVNREEIMRASLRVGRMIRLADGMRAREWERTVLEAIRTMDSEDRAALREHYRLMLGLLEHDERASATGT
jgi:hypothetical protein